MEYIDANGGHHADCDDGEYDDSYMPHNEFELINSVVGDGIQKEKEIGISALYFDSMEELLWVGTKSGHVTSYYGTHFQKYTSFQVHPRDQIRNLATYDGGVLALTNTTLRIQRRRGIPQLNYTAKNMVDMHSLLMCSRNQRVLMSGMQEKLIEFDIGTGKEISAHDTEGSCAILREHSRFVCCGDVPKGRVQLRDSRTLKIVHTLDAHSATLSDFDVHGHHLVTCGQSIRHGLEQPDRFLMVYDLRILRAISPIQSIVIPYQLRFLPSMSSRIAIMSANGQVQMADTACLSTPNISVFQIDFPIMGGCNAISMDISPSNQCLAFGDTANTVYLYSSVVNPVLNPYARETEFADPVEHLPPMSIDDEFSIYSAVPRPHLPPGQTHYLTDLWPERFARQAYRPTPQIDSEILKTMKIISTVGYARNVGSTPRNLVSYPNVKRNGGAVDMSSKDSRDKKKRCANGGGPGDGSIGGSGSGGGNGAGNGRNHIDDELSDKLKSIPNRYRKVVIKYSKMGADDFDFDRYNRTGFCGLEATLPNAYSNPMLQVLYYTEKLRVILLSHGCKRDSCLACELSFLFHMMDISPGMPCQSSNFLRSLRTIPEASALGIILAEENAIRKTNVPRLIQSWNRFILQQIHNQCSSTEYYLMTEQLTSIEDTGPARFKDDTSFVSRLFGMRQDKVNHCTRCKSNVTIQDSLLVANMSYPELVDLKIMTFADVVCSSLCPEQVTPAWCDKCRKYQPTVISRVIKSLPLILNLNAGCDNPQDIAWWQTQMELLYRQGKKSPLVEDNNSTNTKPCRYGLNCNRQPDCKFWHPENSTSPDDPNFVDIGDQLFNDNLSWVPHKLTLHLHENGQISHSDSETNVESPIVETRTYDLYGTCSNIIDPSTGEHNNLIACINVGPTYHARVASPVSQWYIFNDFSITTIAPQEATWFNLTWKLPCVFTFQATEDIREKFQCVDQPRNPISASIFSEDRSLLQRGGKKRITFIPLGMEEVPKMGDLVAIDAEFVTLNQEESELRSDGKVSLLKAAHMSVARITCVRGDGPLEGAPFIDDYIATQEQVVDYVTKFSGIKPGDLDANSSSKHLTTLKSTYQKLRYLVDVGVVFVGHGLKNDFRVINLVVPMEQVVDTVHLFHLPHHRMVSLKFLAWFFLNRKIQGDTHDSVEDAVTALSLYKKYLQLKEEKNLISVLNALYEKGKELNWKIPSEE